MLGKISFDWKDKKFIDKEKQDEAQVHKGILRTI